MADNSTPEDDFEDVPPPEPHHDDLPSLSVRRPILAIVMNLLIVIAGIAAVMGVEVRELPNVDQPIVTVRADFPGAAPETMDNEVTRVLEGAAARVSGVTAISSASEEGNARMRIYFNPSVDINVAANDVREAVAEVERRLPENVENLTVIKANDEADPIMRLSVTSDNLDREALTNLVEDRVVTELLSVPGVADVRMNGNRRRTLNIVVDARKLASHQLSIADLTRALESANLDVPAGSVESADQNLLIRADAVVVEEAKVERIAIRGNTRIGDVASVFYGPEEAVSRVRLNGREVIGLGIIRQAQSNTIEISEGIEREVQQLNRQIQDIDIVVTSNDAVFIRGAVQEVLITLLIGTGIVIGVILLFIGSLRITVIPAITIPIALIGTVAAIWLLGFSINILTLLALVLATGLVVDDAIVVLENIERTRRRGLGGLAAAVLGTRQVFFAVIATTITLISVFVPIAFLPGRSGALFTEFGFVLAIAVGLSSFVALTMTPMLASRLLKPGDGGRQSGGALRRRLVALGHRCTRFYDVTLGVLLRAPLLTAVGSLAIAGAVSLLYQTLDQELVPEEDRGIIAVWLQGPDGVNLEYSDRQVKQVEALLQPYLESGEVTSIYSIVGRYDLHRGFVLAPLADWSERARSQAEIAEELRPKLLDIPGARANIATPNSLSIRTSGQDFEFAVTGSNYDGIAETSLMLIAAMEERLPEILDPVMSYSATQPELSVEIDRERATDLGVDIDGIAATLQAMVDGSEVAEINVDDEAVPVRLESRFGAVNDTDDLNNLYVSTAQGRVVPLSSMISITERGAATELEREGQSRAIEIEGALAEGYALNAAVADLEALAAEILPSGYSVVMLGQAEALEETAGDIALTFAIALIVVLLVLAAQFESWSSAVVIMVTVPFGLAAAVFSLWATGTSLNIYSQIGLVMLVGLMAKNGILIVEFANQLRDQGHSVAEAAREAAHVRLRPVTMTMMTTTLTGIPLILSAGPGAEARNSIGWVIFGGLGIAILGTLYITPVVYALLAPLGKSRAHSGERLSEELEAAHYAHHRDSGRAAAGAE
ncbi:MAG: efflux RND transporter permease subunit [Rhodovibrionaceae bacterium]